MKTLLLADLHGRNPSWLINFFAKEKGIEKLAVLGDIDAPDILQKVRQVSAQNNLRLIYTPGNHEYHAVNLEKGLYGRSILRYYTRMWDSFSEEKQFVKDASKINTSDKSLIVADNEIVYAHASLVDGPSIQNPHVSDVVWGRLQLSNDLLRLNFEKMRELNDFRLFFRGHEHAPAIYTYDANTTRKLDNFTGKFSLDLDNSIAIAKVGAFCDGRYAVYD
jgi:predicted phosphodiesterase